KAAQREVVINAGRAALLAGHRLEHARRKHTFVHRHSADAERIFEALVGTRPVAVERNGKSGNTQPGHGILHDNLIAFSNWLQTTHTGGILQAVWITWTMKKENESDQRSGCPINLTLEVVGDKWSLLIIRDMIFGNRRHFRELLTNSQEGIASNI